MTAKIIDIAQYSPKSTDIFFFDNNIWMYLFCPLGNYNKTKQKHYSAFLKSIQSSKGTIFINSMVLSEFANRYIRMDFELWKSKTGKHGAKYKEDFVGKSDYKVTVVEIKRAIKNIMSFCERASDNFNAINLDALFLHFDEIDFNDSYYIEYLQLSKWKLVTDDGDFIRYNKHSLEVVAIA